MLRKANVLYVIHASRTPQKMNSSAEKIFPYIYRITKNVDRN